MSTELNRPPTPKEAGVRIKTQCNTLDITTYESGNAVIEPLVSPVYIDKFEDFIVPPIRANYEELREWQRCIGEALKDLERVRACCGNCKHWAQGDHLPTWGICRLAQIGEVDLPDEDWREQARRLDGELGRVEQRSDIPPPHNNKHIKLGGVCSMADRRANESCNSYINKQLGEE